MDSPKESGGFVASEDEDLTFSIDGVSEVSVHGWDELQQWLIDERQKWDWLVRGDGRLDVATVASQAQSAWDNIIAGINNVRASGQPLRTALPVLEPLQVQTVLASESETGRLVLDVHASAGDIAAANAYAFLRGILPLQEVRSRDALLGVLLTVVPEFGEPANIAKSLSNERRNYRDGLRYALRQIGEQRRDEERLFKSRMGLGIRFAKRAVRQRRELAERVLHDWHDTANQAVADIRETERTYADYMQLRAPVEYWQTKASDHASKEGKAAFRLTIVALVAALVLIIGFQQASSFLVHNEGTNGQPPVALYVIVSAGLAVLTTLVFWAGRLFSKLYLSEHHLRNDAEERAVMAKTYLAITKESTVEPNDRQIILTALFRGTPDGIVKEDGPPEVSLQALLTRLATGRA